MKRFIAVLSSLLILPAFAGATPVYRDDAVEYSDEMIDKYEQTDETESKKHTVVQRNVAGRSVSRAISAGTANNNSRTNTSTRAVASSPRNAQQTQRETISRTAKTPTVSARSQQSTAQSRANVSARSATGATRTSATSKPVTARAAATSNVVVRGNSTQLTDSGNPLYISNTARVGTSRRSTTARNSSVGTTTPVITTENITETTSTLDALAELTDYCKAQYAQCMDNYCNVLDDNQGRCSCSSNINKYEKTEKSLAALSESFQDVVQKIKYIGLTTSQIEALFAETEAEITMKSNSDTSVLKNSLDAIKKKIVDVSSGKSNTGLLDGLSFDMSGLLDTDFSSGVFDLNSFLGNSKVSNQRGTSLFNTATQRCKTAVLNSCVAQGIDANVVINSYDLAIDKQCIEYERSLNEANDEMRNNVRNAQNILQQARLLLAQKKNEYDLRGCVAALDECMQDEYVCGDDYELCLDPTGKYLANGEIVKGGIPGVAGGSSKNHEDVTSTSGANDINNWTSGGMYGLYATWDYGNDKNAWGKGYEENLNSYIAEKTNTWDGIYNSPDVDNGDMATYLLRRVGYIDSKNDKSYGMCATVLKQCQDYTFESKGSKKKYKPNNEVIRQYLSLALTKIKLKQDTILSDYAETCWNDVYSCLSANNYDENNTNTTASKTAVNACRGDVATCMSVTGYYPKDNETLTLAAMTDWVASKLISCDAGQYLRANSSTGGTLLSNLECVACPTINVNGVNVTTTSDGGQATNCSCPEKYVRAEVSDISTLGEDEYWPIGSKYYTCKMVQNDCGYGMIYAPGFLPSYLLYDKFESNNLLVSLPAKLDGSTEKKYTGVKLDLVSEKCTCPSGTFKYQASDSSYTSYTLADEYPATTNSFNDPGETATYFRAIYDSNQDKKINTSVRCNPTGS